MRHCLLNSGLGRFIKAGENLMPNVKGLYNSTVEQGVIIINYFKK